MFALIIRTLGVVLPLNAVLAATDLNREIVLAPHAGQAGEDLEIVRWQERVRGTEAPSAAMERLGWAYVAKARRTLDSGFYTLAGKTADLMDAQFGPTAESRLLRGHVLHQLHRFDDAATLARQLVAERGDPVDFALLSDVLMEQGSLAEAVVALQRMVDLKPGAEAYSRIAHLRWLKGDLKGAIASMELAARATSPREPEAAAWTASRLAGLHLQAGDASRALALADAAIRHASDFAPALLARGRALVALGRNADAIAPLERATELNPLPEYQWWLADALHAVDRRADAERVEHSLISRGAAADPRTLALYLATRGQDPATAVRLARAELAERRDVFTYDALAWALAAQGDIAAADEAMRTALAEKTKDARLLLHAGVIAAAAGRASEAQAFLDGARATAGTLTPSECALLRRSTQEFPHLSVITNP